MMWAYGAGRAVWVVDPGVDDVAGGEDGGACRRAHGLHVVLAEGQAAAGGEAEAVGLATALLALAQQRQRQRQNTAPGAAWAG